MVEDEVENMLRFGKMYHYRVFLLERGGGGATTQFGGVDVVTSIMG
jgi:hypothetical protein